MWWCWSRGREWEVLQVQGRGFYLVQVFATTHSWDCITAFQEVAQAEENEEGLLIRLEYKKGDIIAAIFDEEDLAIITRDRIEVC
jgi:hypothetical protein